MQIISNLPAAKADRIKDHIVQYLLPLAQPEAAKCARGRLNLWLSAEPNYNNGTYRPAYDDEKLWKACKVIFPDADLAQVYFARGWHGIDWHRDAAYAATDARIINLGAVRLETMLDTGETISLELKGGEIVQFNSKLRHRAIPRSEERIGIGLWKAKIAIPANLPLLPIKQQASQR